MLINEMNQLNINIPDGYEVDEEKVQEFVKSITKPIEKKLPMTWEELKWIHGFRVESDCEINESENLSTRWDSNKNIFPTQEEAEASIALAQLLQLRNAWGGFHYRDKNGCDWFSIKVGEWGFPCLTFQTIELRDKFEETFKDLIEKASPLL